MRSVSLYIAVFLVVAGFSDSIAQQTRVFCVGNSVTAYGYPSDLGVMLGTGYEVSNQGAWGATLLKNGDNSYWNSGSLSWTLGSSPDIVVIKLGTNDSKAQNWDAHKDEFQGDCAALADTFANCSSQPVVFLCFPCPAWNNGFGIQGDVILQEIIPKVQAVATEKGLPLIDLHTPFVDRSDLFPDGVHPSDEGSDSLAANVCRAIQGYIDTRSREDRGDLPELIAANGLMETGQDRTTAAWRIYTVKGERVQHGPARDCLFVRICVNQWRILLSGKQ